MHVLTLLFVLLKVFALTNCSHMQGGAVYYEVIEESNGNVNIKVTGQLNYPSSTTLGSASFICFEALSSPTTQIGSFSVDATSVDSDSNDDWSMVQGSTYLTATEGSWCKLRYSSCCWVDSLFQSSSSWSLPVYINLNKRNGKINSSPIALQPPLARFIAGCPDAIVIPMVDKDGDYITCRYANDSNEGGGLIMTYPYFSVDPYSVQGECRISYNGGGSTHRVGIALIIEDHPSSTSTEVLSYSSLQFVIEVDYLFSYSCSDKPHFVDPTPIHNQIHSLKSGEPLQMQITILSAHSVSEFYVAGVNGTLSQGPSNIGNNQYRVILTWSPLASNAGFNYLCYSAKDENGLSTEQRCLQIYVDENVDRCDVNNGGCSDICSSLGGVVTCSCTYSCWELASDGKRCLPQMAISCSGSRMNIQVDNCAYDEYIGLGDYPDYRPETNPIECRGNRFSSYYEFDFGLTECGTFSVINMNQLTHKNTVKMYVDLTDPGSIISRGSWYLVEITCATEKYFNVSGSFDPQDTHTTIVADEVGFAEIEITFDFYTDSTFSSAYSPYDYPLEVDINDDLYFGILAQTTDTDLELFTISCVAKPDPDPFNIGTYTLINDGCLNDETMVKYQSTNPLINQFSVKAFRFQYGLPGINENTNVAIQCEVVVCSSLFGGTRCSQGCQSSAARVARHNIIYRLPVIGKRQVMADDGDDDDVTTPDRDTEHAQTNIIPLVQSGPLQIKNIAVTEPTDPPNVISTTSNAPGKSPNLLWVVSWWMAFFKLAAGAF